MEHVQQLWKYVLSLPPEPGDILPHAELPHFNSKKTYSPRHKRRASNALGNSKRVKFSDLRVTKKWLQEANAELVQLHI